MAKSTLNAFDSLAHGFMSQLLRVYQSGAPLDIIEFVEQVLLNGQVKLFLGQRIVLKSFYGEPLSPEEETTLLHWRDSQERTTWLPGRAYNNLILESGRRCVVGGTRLSTPRGLCRIDSLGEQDAPLDLKVQGRGQGVKATQLYVQGRQKVYQLVTRAGRRLRATPNHPVLVCREGAPTWVPMGDILIGDQVYITSADLWGKATKLPKDTKSSGPLPEEVWSLSRGAAIQYLWTRLKPRGCNYEYISDLQLLTTALGIPSTVRVAATQRRGRILENPWELILDNQWSGPVLQGKAGCPEWLEEVVSLTYVGYEEVYDLHVPDGHAFWGDGFINHNSGKSLLASAIVLYEFYNLITLDAPARHYGLVPSDPIHIFVLAQSAEQVKDTLFGKIAGYASESLLFQSLSRSGEIEILTTEIRCPGKNVTISAKHSRSQSLVGYNLKLFVLDEASRFETTELGVNTADVLYDNVGKAVSTFGVHGRRMMLSSAWADGDPIQRAYQQCTRDPYSLGFRLTTWHLNHSPNVARDTPTIISDYLKCEWLARLEYEGIRPSSNGGMFTTEVLEACPATHSVIDTAGVDLDIGSGGTTRYYVGVRTLRLEENTAGPQGFGHVDYGLSRDNAAFAFCAPGTHEGNWTIDVQGLVLWRPRLTDNGVRSVSFMNVEEVLVQVALSRRLGYISFDQWNSEATIQRLHGQGIMTELLGASRQKQLLYYTLLRQLMLAGRLRLPQDSIWLPDLRGELLGLVVLPNGKIIHPSAGKDLADAVACAVWNCHERMATSGLMRDAMGTSSSQVLTRLSPHKPTGSLARLRRLKKARI